jgi:phage anti-repressor protein
MSEQALSSTQESTLVPVFLAEIGGTPAHACDGRALHEFLENGENFATWIKARIEKYGFEENLDFVIALENTKAKRGGHNRKDYRLSLDMAKELSMVENNMKGRAARRYFIDCERRALEATGQMVLPAHTATLIPSEQQTLSEIVKRKAETVPAELLGKALAEIWGRLHHHFRIPRYSELPRTQLTEAILYINAMELRTKPRIAEEPKALPFHAHYPLESAAPRLGQTGLSCNSFLDDEKWIDPEWELLMKLKDAGFNVDGPIYSHRAKLHLIGVLYHATMNQSIAYFSTATTKFPYAPVYIR